MTYAKVICDSVAPHHGRLVTLECRFPTSILAQLNTYGSIAKNARSMRAAPTSVFLKEVEGSPVMPVRWEVKGKGMGAAGPMGEADAEICQRHYMAARDAVLLACEAIAARGASKEVVNKLLSPWAETVGVYTATFPAWCHYLNQRATGHADPHHGVLARAIGRAIRDSVPTFLSYGEWHLPYLTAREFGGTDWRDPDSVAVARHASVRRVRRVSYSPFDGVADSPESDKAKHDESRDAGHWSCFEHQAHPSCDPGRRSGRMVGWVEYRQTFPGQVNPDFDFASLD